jgi:4-hydroxymandelate oxidase
MALALGATAVGIGRPILWGLAVDGEAGVGRVLDILSAELEHVMALAGVPSVEDLTPELVV